jgi:hypothetical protein
MNAITAASTDREVLANLAALEEYFFFMRNQRAPEDAIVTSAMYQTAHELKAIVKRWADITGATLY